jgi:hypothetical protein
MPSHLTEEVLRQYLQTNYVKLLTFHYYFDIAHKTVDDTQCLCNSHPSLILGQSIQSLEDRLYLALPQ